MTTAQPSPSLVKRLVVLPALGAISRLFIRFGGLQRLEGIRVLICVPDSEPYVAKLRTALRMLADTDAESLSRGRKCWFAISIRELPPETSTRWTRYLRVLELNVATLRVWSPLMLAGTLAKSSVMHHLLLARSGRMHSPKDINQLAEDHANWFFSQFPVDEVLAAQATLDQSRGVTPRTLQQSPP